MAPTREQAERLARLYAGYTKAYGQAALRGTQVRERDSKAITRSWTEHGTLTSTLFTAHLEGVGPSLGVIILRDDDTTCSFGAIDVDDYNVDHVALEKKVASLGLPLVLVRSKSGGAHLVVFCQEPVPASVLQRKLAEWRALLGYAESTEIFPKQAGRAPSGGDVGSFLNLPYYEAEKPTRYGMFNGQPLSLEEFLDYVESRRVAYADLEDIKYKSGDPRELYFEGPPCLQHLHVEGGFVDGTKRLGMFDVGVYLRKRFPDDWDDKLVRYNGEMCQPPLRNDEIQDLIKSLKKKDYQYQCKQPPIVAHCQRKLCLSRKFGVGDVGPQSAGLEITALTRYQVEDTDDPPMWGMEIGGRRIMIDNSTFYERDAFNKACLAAISRVPIHVPPARWLRIVDEMAANADVVLTPKEVSATGNLWEWIEAYLRGAKAKSMDQVATGGAFIEEGRVYFRVLDLFTFLDTRKAQYKSKQSIYHLLKKNGGESKYTNFKKGGFSVWNMPLPSDVHEEEAVAEPDFSQRKPF